MEEPGFTTSTENLSPQLRDQTVAILGLGLMGGSLALALRGKCVALLGMDPDPHVRRLASEMRVVDRITGDPADLLPQASLVVLAAPVRAIISLIEDLPILHPGKAVVIDLGSTKRVILEAMQKLPERLIPVGGHPMCGKETGGLANADAGLFQDAPFVICPAGNTTPDALNLAEQLALSVGGRLLWLDAETHDHWVAATSHLPYLIANMLAYQTPLEAAPLVGPGFRSTTRLAPGSQQVMSDILITNRDNIIANLASYRNSLKMIEDALEKEDFDGLRSLLSQGANRYEEVMRINRSSAD